MSIEEKAQELARYIDHSLERKLGFVLLLYEFGEEGKMKQATYVSNSQRQDTIAVLEALLNKWRNENTWKL